jgi:hypothetical protein
VEPRVGSDVHLVVGDGDGRASFRFAHFDSPPLGSVRRRDRVEGPGGVGGVHRLVGDGRRRLGRRVERGPPDFVPVGRTEGDEVTVGVVSDVDAVGEAFGLGVPAGSSAVQPVRRPPRATPPARMRALRVLEGIDRWCLQARNRSRAGACRERASTVCRRDDPLRERGRPLGGSTYPLARVRHPVRSSSGLYVPHLLQRTELTDDRFHPSLN